MEKLDLSTEEISTIFRFREKIVDKDTSYRYILNQSLLLKRDKVTEERKKMLNRLHRTEGQIRGIQKMIDEEREYVDVITQLSAVRSSIDRVMGMIVTESLKHCFGNPEKDPKEQEERLAQAINMIAKK